MSNSHNPLAQFEIHPRFPLEFAGYNISVTNATLWLIFACVSAVLVLVLSGRKRAEVPGRFQAAGEMMVEFIQNTLREAAGNDAMKYFPFVFTLFTFILFANLSGMLPYSFTVTSHIIVTFALGISVFLWVMLLNIKNNGIAPFIAHFIPLDKDSPLALKLILGPLLFVIEILSFLSRPISLSIRLAANMTAGHILLKVIAGFVYPMGVFGLLPFLLVIGLVGFEIFIAALQAYIFTVLTCVYLSEVFHGEHHHDAQHAH